MDKRYYVYFDSGTTNSRGYLLDSELNMLDMEKAAVGSKDSAIAGTNLVLIDGLYGIYTKLLDKNSIADCDIIDIYLSGMVTCPYGLCEVPHLAIPITARMFAEKVYPFLEEQRFKRTVWLIPGMKTISEDFAYVNNVRGEEIEIIGLMNTLSEMTQGRDAAIVMPGSHTHTMHVRGNDILGILSNFTGELFHALKTATIMSPELDAKVDSLDLDMVKYGVSNLKKFGFNRALYIGHALRMFDEGDERTRLSYCQGVIFGGVALSLGEYCRTRWTECKTAVIVADPKVMDLYKAVLSECDEIEEVLEIPLSPSKSYALEGFRKIISLRNK